MFVWSNFECFPPLTSASFTTVNIELLAAYHDLQTKINSVHGNTAGEWKE